MKNKNKFLFLPRTHLLGDETKHKHTQERHQKTPPGKYVVLGWIRNIYELQLSPVGISAWALLGFLCTTPMRITTMLSVIYPNDIFKAKVLFYFINIAQHFSFLFKCWWLMCHLSEACAKLSWEYWWTSCRRYRSEKVQGVSLRISHIQSLYSFKVRGQKTNTGNL